MQACHGEARFPWAADRGGVEPRSSKTTGSVFVVVDLWCFAVAARCSGEGKDRGRVAVHSDVEPKGVKGLRRTLCEGGSRIPAVQSIRASRRVASVPQSPAHQSPSIILRKECARVPHAVQCRSCSAEIGCGPVEQDTCH